MAITSLADWKDWLWSELFDDESGERRPVTIIHVDDALFSRAAARGRSSLSAAQARSAFLAAFPGRLQVQRWLSGAADPGEALLPLLVLCCLSASEAADIDENDYRRRLRDLMGWSDVIVNCEALPGLWSRLARALEKRASTRPLVLPDPRFRTQIGHAIELTFPSRNDARRLRADLAGADIDLDSPRAVLAWLEPSISAGRFSRTFEAAFQSFRAAWLKAERALADHRFWCGWKLATDGVDDSAETSPFEILTDEWSARHLVKRGSIEPIELETAMRDRGCPASLSVAIKRSHIIPLVEGEWGRLLWAGRARSITPKAVLIRKQAFGSRYQTLDCQRVSGAAGWGLTYAVNQVLREEHCPRDRDKLLDLRPMGCHRVDGAILARPAFPFRLEATGLVDDLSLEGDIADQFDLERIDSQTWLVAPKMAVEGDLTVIVKPRAGELALYRRMRFTRAVLVPSFRIAAPERFIECGPPPNETWPLDHPTACVTPAARSERCNAPHGALADLIELLAHRTAPLTMTDILGFASQAVGTSGPSPWDIVRALGDAGMLTMLRSRGWRGRSTLSRGPRCALSHGEQGHMLTFEGVLSETFLERLDSACAKSGLLRESRMGTSEWAPLTERVHAGDSAPLEELVSTLDIPLTGCLRPTVSPITSLKVDRSLSMAEFAGPRAPMWLAGTHHPLFHVVSERPDIPPVWVVGEGAQATIWRDREDAILDAYEKAGAAAFKRSDGRLLARDARLPRQVARWIRLSAGIAAGPGPDGYLYAWGDQLERVVRPLAPSLIEGGDHLAIGFPRSRHWSVMAVMSGRGATIAPVWLRAREEVR